MGIWSIRFRHRLRTTFEASVRRRWCDGLDVFVDLSPAVVALLSGAGLWPPLGLAVFCVIRPSTLDELSPRCGERE